MSDIFGGSFNIAIESGLDNSTFLANANSVGDAFAIIDSQLTITNTSGLLLDPATHTLSEQLNFLASNTDNTLNSQYATISDLNNATTELQTQVSAVEQEVIEIGLRLDTAEQAIQEHTNLISDNATAIANHLTDTAAHAAKDIYLTSPGSSGNSTSSRGFYLAGTGIDQIYSINDATYTNTNDFHSGDTTGFCRSFKGVIWTFSTDAGAFSWKSTDGGLNFTSYSNPWTGMVSAVDIGVYTAVDAQALMIGLSNGEIWYSLDSDTWIQETNSPFTDKITTLRFTNFGGYWLFTSRSDPNKVWAWDWFGFSNSFTYPISDLPEEPYDIVTNAPVDRPIISTTSGVQYYDDNTNSWVVSSVITEPCYFSYSTDSISSYYTLFAVTFSGQIYKFDTDMDNGLLVDSWVLLDTITSAGTVRSLTMYDNNKYVITQSPVDNLHGFQWFEYPYTSTHYQVSASPNSRVIYGACDAAYNDTAPANLIVNIDSGAVTCENVQDVLSNLNIANDENRAKFGDYRTSAAQDSIDSTHLTSADLTPYRTANAQDSIDSGKYSTSNPAGYITNAAVSGVYYPVTNPDNYVKLVDANANYYSTSNPSSYQTPSNVASIIATNVPGFAYASQLARNIRIVDAIYGVANPTGLQAYNTLVNALVGISSNTTVFFYPGPHTIASTVTIPAGISLLGADKKTTILTMTATTSTSMFLVNASTVSFQNLTLNMNTSTTGLTLKLIELQSNNSTFFIDNVVMRMDLGATNSVAYGLYSTATDVHSSDAEFNIFECLNTIKNGTNNASRNIYHNPASGSGADIHIESSQFYNSIGGCIEILGSFAPEMSLTNCFCQGTLFDISQTSGNIKLGKGTVLYNANSNTLPFNFHGSVSNWQFGDSGGMPGGTTYMYRGTATSSNNLFGYRISKPTIVMNMHINLRTVLGGGNTCVITVLKNGVATAVTATLTAALLTISDITHAASFTTGDILAVRSVVSGGAGQDLIVQLDLY